QGGDQQTEDAEERHEREIGVGPRNLALAIGKRLRLQGFIVGDHSDLQPQFVDEVSAWVRSGELKYNETFVEGIDNGVEGFLGMLRGENTGKMIIDLSR
ncbi:hypothetical protein ACWG43_06285, partial [Streptomyces albidoflavus]